MKEYIILDNTIKYNNAQNIIDERMLYRGEELWGRGLDKAHKYKDPESAIAAAKVLREVLPVKVFMLEPIPNGINFAEVNFS